MKYEIIYIGKDNYIEKKLQHRKHYQPSRYNIQQINRVLQNDKVGRYRYVEFDKGNYDDDILGEKVLYWISYFEPKFNFTDGGVGGVDSENDDMYFANNDVNKDDFKVTNIRPDYENEKVYFTVAGVEYEKRLLYHKKSGYYFVIGEFKYNLDGKIIRQYGKINFEGDEPEILDKDYNRMLEQRKWKDMLW